MRGGRKVLVLFVLPSVSDLLFDLANITTVVSLDFEGDNSLNDSIWFQSPVFNTFIKVKVAQSCPTLCDTGDYTVHGILQARRLEWGAFTFSKGSSQPRDRTQVSHTAGKFFTSWATREAQDTGVGSLFLLQRIFLTQESNRSLLHCRQILSQLNYEGSPIFKVKYILKIILCCTMHACCKNIQNVTTMHEEWTFPLNFLFQYCLKHLIILCVFFQTHFSQYSLHIYIQRHKFRHKYIIF